MAGILSYAAAGAVGGFGQGLADQGKAKRDAMLRMIEQDRADSRASQRAAARQDKQIAAAGDRADKLNTANQNREDARSGLFTMTEKLVDPKTNKVHTYGITKTGTKVDLGEAPPEKASTSSEPMVQTQDENGNIIYTPRDQAAGMSPPLSEKDRETKAEADAAAVDDARAQAEKEAKEKAGWLSTDSTDFASTGGSRSAWIENRTQEILQERKNPKAAGATQDNVDMTGVPGKDVTGKGTKALEAPKAGKAPKGTGTAADPYAASSQADIDWFKANAKPGEVIVVNGKKYTR
jgi:hypothetical protein